MMTEQSQAKGANASLYLPYVPMEPYLPENTSGKEKTLVLDLDETLIFCQDIRPADSLDLPMTTIKFLKRPGLTKFFTQMSQLFEIVIFTANCKEYADAVIDSLPEIQACISHRLYWDHVTVQGPERSSETPEIISEGGPQSYTTPRVFDQLDQSSMCFKDISKLGRPLEKVVMVDSQVCNISRFPDNGVLVGPWKGDPKDKELAKLKLHLMGML